MQACSDGAAAVRRAEIVWVKLLCMRAADTCACCSLSTAHGECCSNTPRWPELHNKCCRSSTVLQCRAAAVRQSAATGFLAHRRRQHSASASAEGSCCKHAMATVQLLPSVWQAFNVGCCAKYGASCCYAAKQACWHALGGTAVALATNMQSQSWAA
jgi:hypothetical protein